MKLQVFFLLKCRYFCDKQQVTYLRIKMSSKCNICFITSVVDVVFRAFLMSQCRIYLILQCDLEVNLSRVLN